MSPLTVEQIRAQLEKADAQAFAVLERSLAADTRKGVRQAVEVTRRRLESEHAEQTRVHAMYVLQDDLLKEAGGTIAVGLDEVGRGPVAGPVAVGAVVLDSSQEIAHLNDSKQLSASVREELAKTIQEQAIAWTVQFSTAQEIDEQGISTVLRQTFKRALLAIEEQGVYPHLVLLDGRPLHIDAREKTMVKGDARIASIAAASIVAKVARDRFMDECDGLYPGYGFAEHKGYGTEHHREAIERLGLSPIHRKSFCSTFMQQRLF